MKRIFAIFFATLILVSHSGIVFATHYCMGNVADISIGFATKAHQCEMGKMSKVCVLEAEAKNTESHSDIMPINCCDDDFVQLQLNESYDAPSSFEATDINDFLVAFTLVFVNPTYFQSEVTAGYVDYSPPLLRQNLPVLFQSFLI